MRCNKCGASSSVKATRENPALFVTKRSRVCDNGHRFFTYETHSASFSEIGARYTKHVVAWNKQVARYARDLRVWIDCTKRGRKQIEVVNSEASQKSLSLSMNKIEV